jgi:uncharacterized phiE125 gp8 family phage protein
MTLSLKTPPAALALDWVQEVKGHLRLDSEEEQPRVASILIPAATQFAESETDRQLITATWTLYLDAFPCYGHKIELPKPPLKTVTSVKYYDTAGVLQTWAAAGNYSVQAPAGPFADCGYILPAYAVVYPVTQSRADAVEIEFTSGYGDTFASVPPLIRAAMLLIVGEQFERREESIAGTIISRVPMAAHNLLWPFRVWR